MDEHKPSTASSYIKMGFVVMLIITLVGLAYFWFIANTKQRITVSELPTPVTAMDVKPEVFRYTKQKNASSTETSYHFFKNASSSNEVETHAFTLPISSSGYSSAYDFERVNSFEKNLVLFVRHVDTDVLIYALDLSVQGSAPKLILTTPRSSKDEIIMDAVFLGKGSTIALTSGELTEFDYVYKNVTMRVFSLEDMKEVEKHTLLVDKDKNQDIFAKGTLGFSGVTLDAKKIYLKQSYSVSGNDFYKWYIVDREKSIVQKLEKVPHSFESLSVFDSTAPKPSPLIHTDSSKIIGVDFHDGEVLENESYSTGITNPGGDGELRCLLKKEDLLKKYPNIKGVLLAYDITTGTITEIYRNQSTKDAYCQDSEDVIFDTAWASSTQITFTKYDGIYLLDIYTKELKKLITFEKGDVLPEIESLIITSVRLPYIIFQNGHVIDTRTDNIINISSFKAHHGFGDNKEGGYFSHPNERGQ